MNNYPKQKLKELVNEYGVSLSQEKRQCQGLLMDFCLENKKEINLLVQALNEGIPADLLSCKYLSTAEECIQNLSKRLEEDHGMLKQEALWAVESWAFALGLIPDREIDAGSDTGEKPPLQEDYPPGTGNIDILEPDRRYYLMQDINLIKENFMTKFRHLKEKELIIDDDMNWIEFKKFPLPECYIDENNPQVFYRPRYENILLLIDEYPQCEPFGIFVYHASSNYEKIKFILIGDTEKEIPEEYECEIVELLNRGWGWIPFPYDDNWKFDKDEVDKGSNLLSYLEKLFSALGGREQENE